MSRRIGLLGVGAYVPERVVGNDEWTALVDTSDEWITTRTGIRRRRFAAEGESTVDLAVPAARDALAQAGLEAGDVDEIIVATDTPEVTSPDTAAFVQHRLGARQIPAYDLGGSGCAGFLQALDIARSRVGGEGRRILVIGVEVLSKVIDLTDRNTCVLFGDAAGAAIVGAGEEAAEILQAVAYTDGSRSEILGIEVGGTRLPCTPENAPGGRLGVVMNGREVFKEAVRRMSAAALEVLRRAGLGRGDVDLVIPHQANLRILRAVARELGMPLERVYTNLEEYGNTGSASIPLALAEARAGGRVGAGDLVLLTSFGAGFHWGAALVRF